MLDDRLAIPLYKQLSAELQEKITAGRWKYNEKIPTEPELCEAYHISRMTVRLALNELKNLGYVYRKQGRGTFVSQPKIEQHLTSFYQFSDDIEKSGYRTKKTLLSFSAAARQEIIAKKMGLKPDEAFFRIERLHFCNDTPFSTEISFIPSFLCPDLTEDDIKDNGLYHSLSLYGQEPNKATENFEAILLESKYQVLLELPKISPGFYVERISYQDEKVIEFCKSYVRGDMIRYTTFLTL